eukprot:TRINITY_DN16942_c0_g1_i1.p1 TRINITY_DN16942_c0_g1~~TRINITY_DN16942_c0_g1_i1.p1  ORF type:complete len:358 (+),score=129.84 TRINITY_DN16942_c0_g1_i1:45-1118(+)
MLRRTLGRALSAKPRHAEVSLEVLGEYSLRGERMSAGALLGVMDLCAARSAFKHAEEVVTGSQGVPVTVAMDMCNFREPVLHGDLVRIESSPVLVGRSSICVWLDCYAKSLRSEEWTLVHNAAFTMVVVDAATQRPIKSVPQLLETCDEDRMMKEKILERRAVLADWEALQVKVADLPVEELSRPDPTTRPFARSVKNIAASRIELRKMFLPRSLNYNNTIFGGELLQWMESGALYCAMNFVGHEDVVTLAMNRVQFKRPIRVKDWVTLSAEIVYISKHTLHVNVTVAVEGGDETLTTHEATFICMGLSRRSGRKQPITTMLQIDDDDEASLRKYTAARGRYKDWKDRYQMLKEPED